MLPQPFKTGITKMQIGGKVRKAKLPSNPQIVIQAADSVNQYVLIKANEKNEIHVEWTGDANAATKFDSKYAAKARTREIENIPSTRVFKSL